MLCHFFSKMQWTARRNIFYACLESILNAILIDKTNENNEKLETTLKATKKKQKYMRLLKQLHAESWYFIKRRHVLGDTWLISQDVLLLPNIHQDKQQYRRWFNHISSHGWMSQKRLKQINLSSFFPLRFLLWCFIKQKRLGSKFLSL